MILYPKVSFHVCILKYQRRKPDSCFGNLPISPWKSGENHRVFSDSGSHMCRTVGSSAFPTKIHEFLSRFKNEIVRNLRFSRFRI